MLLEFIVLVYLLVRLPSLTQLPVFCDEGIYIHWAQKIGHHFSSKAFLPLSDGKTPLFMWLVIPALSVFSDPLFAGRFVSVFSGLATLLAVYMLAKKYFDRQTAYIAVTFFSVVPYVVFFDKMALTDAMLGMFYLWTLYFALETIKNPNWKTCIFLGLSLGGGIWVKTPGLLSFIFLPVVILAVESKTQRNLMPRIGLLTAAEIVGFGIYNLLRISPDFPKLSSRNEDYYFPVSRITESPLDPLAGHMQTLADWFPKLLTWPVLILVAVSLFLIIAKRNKTALVIFLWGFLPLVPLVLLLKVFTARYLLFGVYPLVFLAAWALSELYAYLPIRKSAIPLSITTFFILIPSLLFDFQLSKNPAAAPLPQDERRTYLEDWTSGYGLREIAAYLAKEAGHGKVLVLTDGFFGTLPDGLQIYLKDNPDISVWYMEMTNIENVLKSSNGLPKYLLVNKSHTISDPNVIFVREYPRAQKPDGTHDALLLYKVNENESKN